MNHVFKINTAGNGQSRAADKALAFAAANAMRRFAPAACIHLTADGEPVSYAVQDCTARELLRRLGTDVSRYRPLRGINIEREARAQQERLLNEDIESAFGWAPYTGRCMVCGPSTNYRCVPDRPVNHEPAGFDKLDAAFEATFDVG